MTPPTNTIGHPYSAVLCDVKNAPRTVKSDRNTWRVRRKHANLGPRISRDSTTFGAGATCPKATPSRRQSSNVEPESEVGANRAENLNLAFTRRHLPSPRIALSLLSARSSSPQSTAPQPPIDLPSRTSLPPAATLIPQDGRAALAAGCRLPS